jgi:hypothetical protein
MRTGILHGTGGICPGRSCWRSGWHEYGGMCAKHWAALTPAQRAAAEGKEPPVKEIVEHRVEIHRARNRLLVALLWLWGAAMTVGVVLMAWRMR